MRADDPAFLDFAAAMRRAVGPLEPGARALAAVAQSCDLRALRKGDHLLRIGEVAGHVFFLRAGLLRYYFLDPQTGIERTGQFFDAGQVVTDADSFLTGRPCRAGMAAIERTEIVCLPRAAMLRAFDADHAIERFGRLMVEEALVGVQRRAERLLTLTPEELYRTFVTTRPEVARRVPQYLIASYLGITPEALSRIRARAARREPPASG